MTVLSRRNAGAPSAPISTSALELSSAERAAWLETLRAAGSDPGRRRRGPARRARGARPSRASSRRRRRRAPSRRPWPARRSGAYTLDLADRPGRNGQRLAGAPQRRPLRGRGRRQAAQREPRRAARGRSGSGARAASWRGCATPTSPTSSTPECPPTGQPYLVLEHVEGEPIDRYCDAQGARRRGAPPPLPRRARGGRPRAREPDRAPGHQAVQRPGRTRRRRSSSSTSASPSCSRATEPAARPRRSPATAGRALTPEYAAPEQLTRRRHHDRHRRVCAGRPALPAPRGPASGRGRAGLTRASAQGHRRDGSERPSDSSTASDAAARATTARRAPPPAEGDLDTIVAKALKKDPGERYASVTALADDVRRYLRTRADQRATGYSGLPHGQVRAPQPHGRGSGGTGRARPVRRPPRHDDPGAASHPARRRTPTRSADAPTTKRARPASSATSPSASSCWPSPSST